MPTTTERTPQEWAVFCAREVMGWSWCWYLAELDGRGCWRDVNGIIKAERPWSPYENPPDALEVLERLEKLTGRWATLEHVKDLWVAGLGDWEDYVADAIGTHFGPAVCLLAQKVLG